MTFFADFTSGQSNVSYTRMRQLLATSGGGLQEGVIGAGDLKVGQRAAGANMSVDVAVGDAWVQYDTGTRNGLSHVWSDAIANVAFNASDATNPRIDQIGVQLNDVAVGAGTGGNTPALRYVPGTATAGATLDNRNGAVTTGLNDWMRLADILIPAASTSVVTANIRDRRPWARGAYYIATRTAGDISITSVSPTFTTFDGSAAWTPRIECSGVAIRIRFHANTRLSIADSNYTIRTNMDAGANAWQFNRHSSIAAGIIGGPLEMIFAPSAGSHVFLIDAAVGVASTLTIQANANSPAVLEIEELVRPNAANT